MFNKYWREYPWFFQLFQFILLIFICATFFLAVGGWALTKITGVSLEQIQNLNMSSTVHVRTAMLSLQAISQLGIFLLPVLLFAYAVHPRPLEYLNIRKPQKNIHWFIILMLAIGSIPISSGIAGLIDMLPLTDDMRKAQIAFNEKQKAFTNMQSPAEFIFAFVVIGIIPAIGEELLFRGVMMRFAAKRMVGTIFWPILVSAVFFAMMHQNIVGFVSILISGVILGYIYYLTGSLIMSMFAHFIVNGSQITLLYLAKNNAALTRMMENNDVSWPFFIGGIILFSISFYLLWKYRTPLPADWTNDYNAAEMAEKTNERNHIF